MYNNEEGGPAFNEFLDVIGQRVRLKGFAKYKAGLCNKSKSSLFSLFFPSLTLSFHLLQHHLSFLKLQKNNSFRPFGHRSSFWSCRATAPGREHQLVLSHHSCYHPDHLPQMTPLASTASTRTSMGTRSCSMCPRCFPTRRTTGDGEGDEVTMLPDVGG